MERLSEVLAEGDHPSRDSVSLCLLVIFRDDRRSSGEPNTGSQGYIPLETWETLSVADCARIVCTRLTA
jgi:hypothetical protein